MDRRMKGVCFILIPKRLSTGTRDIKRLLSIFFSSNPYLDPNVYNLLYWLQCSSLFKKQVLKQFERYDEYFLDFFLPILYEGEETY